MLDLDHDLPARQASYALLSRLFLHEIDTHLAQYLSDLPVFEDYIPDGSELGRWLDEMAAAYHTLFGINIHPYESIFVGAELMLNTSATERVESLYQRCGFETKETRVGAADHLGLELRLMHDLLAAERQAIVDGDPEGLTLARQRQAECLHHHLARWAPICAATMTRVTSEPIYNMLAMLTTELVLSEVGRLAAPVAPDLRILPPDQPPPATPLVSEEADLDPEAPTSLRPLGDSEQDEGGPGIGAIVRRLLTPAEVGIFLTRQEIRDLGRLLQLPAPVGDRFFMLRGLFHAAGEYDQALALLDALHTRLAEADAEVVNLMDGYRAWGPYGAVWRQCLARGSALLTELRQMTEDFLDSS